MPFSRKVNVLVLATALFLAGMLCCDLAFVRVSAQSDPLTYPEINTALQTKLPNQSFKNKTELVAWMISQIKRRKIDKALTKDREDDLRQAGATNELIQVIRANSPALAAATPTPDTGPVDLGDLVARAVNLVKPEYTEEARKARTSGEVKLALELDEAGRVTSVARLTVLENGLTEKAIEAARRSTFRPATRNGKPARGTGILKFNFKINLIDVAATLATANELRSKRDCGRAIAEYTRVLDADSRHAKALLGRGSCHLMEARYDLAHADLSAAALSDQRDPDIFFYLAIVYDFRGDPATAAENYEKAVRLRPELDRQPTFDCLYIDRRSMTPEQAKSAANGIITACNQASRDATGQFAGLLYYKRGIAYRMKADFDKAIADFENVRRTNPQFTAISGQLQIAFNSRGLEAFNKKDYKKAFDDVSSAIKAEPQSPTPYINRCAIYLYAWKQYDEAISDCSSAIRLATRSSTAYSHRGYAYEMTNSRNEAIADYKKALEIDPQNQTARTNLNRLQPQPPSMKY